MVKLQNLLSVNLTKVISIFPETNFSDELLTKVKLLNSN